MVKFLLFLERLVNLYLYYVVMACFLAIIPYINPNYPLFNFIFKTAGFYLIPPAFGILLSPMVMLMVLVLAAKGINYIRLKYYPPKQQPKIIVISADEFYKKIQQQKNNDFNDKNNNSEENK